MEHLSSAIYFEINPPLTELIIIMKGCFKFILYVFLFIGWMMITVASTYGEGNIAAGIAIANFFLPFLILGYVIWKMVKKKR